MLILSQLENRVPLSSGVLGGVDSVAPSYHCKLTDSIKPSLLFSFLICVSSFQRIFIQNLFYQSTISQNKHIAINLNM